MLHKTGDLRSVSVDRIDGKYGYTKGNVQLVCQWVNFAKNSRSTEEIQAILTEYVTWHNASSVKPLVI